MCGSSRKRQHESMGVSVAKHWENAISSSDPGNGSFWYGPSQEPNNRSKSLAARALCGFGRGCLQFRITKVPTFFYSIRILILWKNGRYLRYTKL